MRNERKGRLRTPGTAESKMMSGSRGREDVMEENALTHDEARELAREATDAVARKVDAALREVSEPIAVTMARQMIRTALQAIADEAAVDPNVQRLVEEAEQSAPYKEGFADGL